MECERDLGSRSSSQGSVRFSSAGRNVMFMSRLALFELYIYIYYIYRFKLGMRTLIGLGEWHFLFFLDFICVNSRIHPFGSRAHLQQQADPAPLAG